MAWFSSIFAWFSSIFFTKSAEIAIVGLQGSGKTSLVNVLEIGGEWTESVVPTVAFSYRTVRRNNIKLKIWDVAGQPRYRNLWERYCKGSDAVVFVVDSHDREHFDDAKFELHHLLGEKGLVGTPLLVLGNKNDLPGHASVEEIISKLGLDTITNRPVSCYSPWETAGLMESLVRAQTVGRRVLPGAGQVAVLNSIASALFGAHHFDPSASIPTETYYKSLDFDYHTTGNAFWMLVTSILHAAFYPFSLLSSAVNLSMAFIFPINKLDKHLDRGKGILGPLKEPSPEQDWMKGILGSKPLCQLSIPGTHDSAAYNYQGDGHEFWNCQDIPLLAQLDAGIRAFDLRYALRDGKLLFFHSTALLDEKAEVVDIIWGFHAWLQRHPSETIFVSLKVDNGKIDAPEVQAAMAAVLEDTNTLWVSNLTTQTTLDTARGRLILIRRFPFPENVGFSVSDGWKVNNEYFKIPLNEDATSSAWIEDFYLLKEHPRDAISQISIKKNYTIEHLQRAQAALTTNPNDLYVTFSSAVGDRNAVGGEDVTPKVMSLGRGNIVGVNQHLIEWCLNAPKFPVGIVFMDFVSTKRPCSQDGDRKDLNLINCFIEKQDSS